MFYGERGRAYVFQAYGLHACLNAIAGRPGEPGCVLIRALEPLTGTATMRERRGPRSSSALASGPARLTQALGVTRRENGADLTRGLLVIAPPPAARRIEAASGPRIGITRARDLPLRFWIRGNPYVSPPRA